MYPGQNCKTPIKSLAFTANTAENQENQCLNGWQTPQQLRRPPDVVLHDMTSPAFFLGLFPFHRCRLDRELTFQCASRPQAAKVGPRRDPASFPGRIRNQSGPILGKQSRGRVFITSLRAFQFRPFGLLPNDTSSQQNVARAIFCTVA